MVNAVKEEIRPRHVYPDHSKQVIVNHLLANGWKPVGFRVPTGDEYYFGKGYSVFPASAYRGTEPRLIVQQIPGMYIGLVRSADANQ